MACICDECDDEIFLDEAEEVDGRILCPDCLDALAEEDKEEEDARRQPSIRCPRCYKDTPAKNVITKNTGPMCTRCAHKYELEIWTPPDHSAAECPLCTAH